MISTSTPLKTTLSGWICGNTSVSFAPFHRKRYVIQISTKENRPFEVETLHTQDRILEPGSLLPEIPNWFPGARLNYAENLLIRKDDGIALTEATESGVSSEISYKELNARVSQMAAALRANGLKIGDRVAGKPVAFIHILVLTRPNLNFSQYHSCRNQWHQCSHHSAGCCKHWGDILQYSPRYGDTRESANPRSYCKPYELQHLLKPA